MKSTEIEDLARETTLLLASCLERLGITATVLILP